MEMYMHYFLAECSKPQMKYHSPQKIITGSTIDYHLHCQLECGSYVQTDEAHGSSMQSRTIGDIALLPAGN